MAVRHRRSSRFLFVPLSIGLAFITAILETRLGTDEGPRYLRMTKFWGSSSWSTSPWAW